MTDTDYLSSLKAQRGHDRKLFAEYRVNLCGRLDEAMAVLGRRCNGRDGRITVVVVEALRDWLANQPDDPVSYPVEDDPDFHYPLSIAGVIQASLAYAPEADRVELELG